MTTTKTCSTCEVPKELDAFPPLKKGKHGRAARCRECQRRVMKARRATAAVPAPEPTPAPPAGAVSDGAPLAALRDRARAVDPELLESFAVQLDTIAMIDAMPVEAVARNASLVRERRAAADVVSKAMEQRASEGRSARHRVEAVERLVERIEGYASDD